MVFKEATFHGKQPEIEVEFVNHAALEIAAAEALATAGDIDASDVQVTSDADDIVLTGTVATVGEIERATAIVQAVQGVHDVRNQILLG
ncbi:BON domain-containing protein [Rhizobium sp. BG4]|uniref:BON domain-containing protein n=1 Tax=Rhizobium sp. BG4 TaxID=2613770 RepID=UPI00193CB572|nr:BON domain-containing protein [Rhizobium sp. BG4]QRM43908.1 BON domain-containing protein [Rhizobium sp. BG4]